MLDLLHHPALMQIRVVQQLERGEDGAAGNTGAGDDPGYLMLGALRRPFSDGRIHGLPVLGAGAAVDHTRIVEQVLAADRLQQVAPMLLVAPRGKDPLCGAPRRPVSAPSKGAFLAAKKG